MDFTEGMEQLSQLCKNKDWFFDIGTDALNRYVVYVKFMNDETLSLPDNVAGRQVLVHFAFSKTATREQFTNTESLYKFSPLETIEELVTYENDSDEKSILYLTRELDRLEKQCGSKALQDIFYEVHDRQNAVTFLSEKYPEVRSEMERLYNEYGFDVVYEELDG